MREPATRLRFLQLVGGAGAAAAVSTLLAACGGQDEEIQEAKEESGPAQPATDLETVNDALFLEYLVADLYEQVLGTGALRPEYERIARQIRQDEAEHVDALADVVRQLAGTPVDRPKSTFGSVIDGGEQRIIETAATLENLAAAAYLEQASRVENQQLLQAMLAIHTVEARHAAALNDIAGNGFRGGGPLSGSIPNGALAEPMTREEVLKAAAPFFRS